MVVIYGSAFYTGGNPGEVLGVLQKRAWVALVCGMTEEACRLMWCKRESGAAGSVWSVGNT